MSHVHQGVCRQEWEEFLARPAPQQSLEMGAMLMARWFQPHADVSVKKVKSCIQYQPDVDFSTHPGNCV